MSNAKQSNIENRISNEQLVARIQAGEDTAENMLQLWQQSEGFIAKLAMKYQNYAEQEDLKQEGYIGLCEAVRKYDPEQGVSFLYYSSFWIKQAMKRYIDNCCSVVRIPVHAREWIQKYNRVVREYRKHYGTEPQERVLCVILGVSREKLSTIQKDARMGQIDSLSRQIAGEDESLILADVIASDEDMEGDAMKALDTDVIVQKLWIAVDSLPDVLPDVVRFRYKEKKTLKETSQSLGVNVSRARDLESKSLRKLIAKANEFRGYYEEYLQAAPIRNVSVAEFNRTWTSSVERDALQLQY